MADGQISKKVQAEMCNKKFLMNLPSDIIVEIFSRLPAVTVINCKLVCKKSHSLLSTTEFAKLHLSRSTLGLVSFQSGRYSSVCRLFEFKDEIDHQDIYYNPVIKLDLSVVIDVSGPTTLIGSVNGLVCFRNSSVTCNDLYVCNPITREYVIIPLLKQFAGYSTADASGFGVSTISGQYKVVLFFHSTEGTRLKTKKNECFVYTIGTGSWRIIEDLPFAYDFFRPSEGAFSNGNLHWVVKDIEGTDLISCFYLEMELFQPFPAPFLGKQNKTTFYDLGVVSGSLCLCDNTSDDIVIWVMKLYGVKTSWAKEFVIAKFPDFEWGQQVHIRALYIFKDGVILLEGYYFFSYSNQEKMDPNYCVQTVLHVSSFLSLKDFVLEKVRMI